MARDLPGNSGYDNVRVNVSAPGAASVQLPADWENGFAISPDYETTADISVLYSAGGEYTITLTLVDLDNGEEVLASESIELSVAYAVDSAEDLNNVRNNPGADYIQVADIDLNSSDWIPIGTLGTPFSGSYDGQGYKISNLTIDNLDDSTKDSNVGLFGYVQGGVFENIVLENVSVIGKTQVGGLVGLLDGGTITNSHVVGDVSVTGQINTGGLVGINYGLIQESSTEGAVNGSHLGVVGIVGSTGGLVGTNTADGEITGSFSSANVVTNAEGGSGVVGYTGGLVGFNSAEISRSYATGNVTLTGAYKYYVGGLAGGNTAAGSISESYAVGTVNGLSPGGLVGRNDAEGIMGNSYYDTDTTTMTDDEGKGIPKTTVEMKQLATFSDWDFDDTWAIDEGQTYPYLQWQADN